MRPLTNNEWAALEDFLERIADMEKPTWQQKRDVVKENLTSRGLLALFEIVSWDWD